MALAQIGKQLAQQALLDSLRPADAVQVPESVKTAPAAAGEHVGATIMAQIQAMQKAVKEDEELVVLVHNGLETMRAMEIYMPSWGVAVLTGIDANRTLTRVVTPVEQVQLICKVMKVQTGAKAVKVNLIAPKG